MAGRGGGSIEATPAHHSTHGRVMPEPIGIVEIFRPIRSAPAPALLCSEACRRDQQTVAVERFNLD
jgi:hypothetical protein